MDWFSEWEWTDQRKSECMSEWVSEWVSKCAHARLYEWMNLQVNEWISECVRFINSLNQSFNLACFSDYYFHLNTPSLNMRSQRAIRLPFIQRLFIRNFPTTMNKKRRRLHSRSVSPAIASKHQLLRTDPPSSCILLRGPPCTDQRCSNVFCADRECIKSQETPLWMAKLRERTAPRRRL